MWDTIFSSDGNILKMLTVRYYKLRLLFCLYSIGIRVQKSVQPVTVTQSVAFFSRQATRNTEKLTKECYIKNIKKLASRSGARSLTLWQTVINPARIVTVDAESVAPLSRIG